MVENSSNEDRPLIFENKVNKWQVIFAVLIVLIVSSVTVLRTYHVDYVIISPGTATPVGEKINILGVETDQPKGDIRFLTVLVNVNRPTLFEYLKAKYYDDSNEVLKWKDVYGNVSSKDNSAINEALMLASQNSAKVVGLKELGCTVTKNGDGALITAIEKDTAASKAKLKESTVIKTIDGQEVQTDDDAIAILGQRKPGDKVTLGIAKDGESEVEQYDVELGENPDKKGVGFLGVGLTTSLLKFDYPIDINIDPGDVSGPSAGLAFTLSIIDQLSPGELTGNKDYAVTGEMSLDGSVGAVGGVAQKAVAAKKAGAKYMLVPKGEGKDAKKSVPSMKVFEVSNIDEALQVMAENGGVPLPQVRACPDS